MKYTSTKRVENDVKNMLSNYFAANKLDDSIFPRVIRTCVAEMGLMVLPTKYAAVQIKNCEGVLPADFYRVCRVEASRRKRIVAMDGNIRTEQKYSFELNLCETVHDSCTDECGNAFKMVQHVGYDVYEWHEFTALFPSEKCKKLCSSDFVYPERRKENEFEIIDDDFGKVIRTTMADGVVYVEYLGVLESETEFYVPDHPTIENWLYRVLIKECFQKLYYSGDDVVQRLSEAKSEAHVATETARQFYSRSGRKGYYRMAQALASRMQNHTNWLNTKR